MKVFRLFFLLTIINFTQIYKLICQDEISHSLSKDSVSKNEIINRIDSSLSKDTINNSLNQNNKNLLLQHISEDDFFYADTKRYTIDGSLPLSETHLKTIPTMILGGVYTGVFIIQHYLQLRTIWKEQGNFKIAEDGQYAMYADKAGHIFGCYFTSYLARESLMMVGFSWDASNIIGTAIGLGYSTYVEVLDGFGKYWGFSPSDFYADIAGAGLFIGQHYIPFLQNFTPKFMYIPATWHGELERVPHDAFIDDYSSHTLWISVNVHNILPVSMKPYWPSWLELSLGYAVRNLCDPFHNNNCDKSRSEQVYDYVWGNRKFIVSLDYNLVKILPEGGSFWNWLRQSLNYFKLPSPAIEFGSTTKFFLLYPFPINIGNFRF